ncbi:uncharacterized protein LOC100118386 [Nasonia vitripennis]|uniref:DUF1279 domain-containing protein n=1 Tax=Nasonia vitripennis TaxID=7425 RepID=A0A7M7G809_NASVI|nr:uncharacterized protein LOC100118386 [Nasonia vitripennis]
MALSRIGNSADLANLFVRSSYAATSPRHGRQNVEKLHATVVRRYPEAPRISLPSNVSEIFNTETSRFAPERARDLLAPLCLYGSNTIGNSDSAASSNIFGFANSIKMQQLDSRVESYDCFGSVSLNGSMQTNVPKPFCANGKDTYLNMPGGQWARDSKYLAENMRKSHFKIFQMRHAKRSGGLDGLYSTRALAASDPVVRSYSTSVGTKTESKMSAVKPTEEKKDGEGEKAQQKKTPLVLSKRERMQILIKDYGKTIIVFHVGISLISLGIFYTIVSSGFDPTPIIQYFSGGTPEKAGEDELVTNIMSEGSTFLIAYAVHKLFAPVRLSLTLALTPMLVKYLRRKGIIKPPKKLKAALESANTTAPR